MKLSEIYLYLKQDISKIEKEIENSIDAQHPVLIQASSHLLKAGGKRIRPVFVLLGAQFGQYDLERVKLVAVPLEMIHMGSLVHDDVIDDAELRRGRKTIKAKWDNRVAMYTGDYMFAKAIEIASQSQEPRLHEILSDAMVEMCIGEVEQIKDQFNADQNLKIYLRRIKRKTALLISVSCELGALIAGADRHIQKCLKRYGYYTGMAFQITDDILDFVGTEKELGKPAGSDLLQGNVTLPALYAMERDAELKNEITHFLESHGTDKVDMNGIISKIKETGAVKDAKIMSDLYLEKANAALEELPDIRAKRALSEIAQYIGDRKF
ncbi:heptaprenyl diphosphate synthase component II [Salisediminibacterium beveridgei]|uniref:Heptaprenyl diphosphate synthase component 2 n=1 Tax=Salisediminibacterium beveridgei TaxID=632773 RepID=A0A1D7QUW9_9BACI|nr:heptaprenyl diphosphate synthase component II [Salisediminibacterium beveridgei]AOM82804.1 Heptaprenyl diphosphate synthase component II [Salisediminibacterium beveridgei]